jgi:hypothetical protein
MDEHEQAFLNFLSTLASMDSIASRLPIPLQHAVTSFHLLRQVKKYALSKLTALSEALIDGRWRSRLLLA